MTKTDAKPGATPHDLLKAAVSGKPETTTEPETRAAAWHTLPPWLRDVRLLGLAGAALAVGTVLGAGVTALSGPSRGPNDALAALSATLDAGRIETARLGGEVGHLNQALADLKTVSETARKEATARGSALVERLAQVDRSVGGKLTALGERFEQSERDQNARIGGLSTQLDKRPPATPPTAKAEPTQTGSITDVKGSEPKGAETRTPEIRTPETKPKPAAEKPTVIDGWAVRDVYDGAAILENRKRRIVEVAPGDTLPGVGRVEAVERRGREWVVVTRQGVVTPQPW